MLVLSNVFASSQSMSLLQLLFSLVACTGYALAQGSLVGCRTRVIAGGMALSAALGFVFEAAEWTHAVMLMAFAVASLGIFAGAVWWLSALLGFGREPLRVAESSFFIDSLFEAELDIHTTLLIPPAPSLAQPRASPAHSG